MNDNDRQRIIDTAIFARVTPEQKLNLIKLMQDQGLTTAMTGGHWAAIAGWALLTVMSLVPFIFGQSLRMVQVAQSEQ